MLRVTLFAALLGGAASADDSGYPMTLYEVAPLISFVQQSFPINNTPTAFWSSANPGAVLRFTPVWRGKYPLFFHLGGVRLVEQNSAGVTVTGEHINEKYLWTFGARFGFFPLQTRRWLLIAGMQFDHEAFIRDLGSNIGHLNKVLFPTLALISSLEWYRGETFSALVDVGFKADFSVPMDVWLSRNGILLSAKLTGRWRLDGYHLFAAAGIEPHWMNTTLGDASRTTVSIGAMTASSRRSIFTIAVA